MCKTILFHSIANSAASSTWNESSLLPWLNQCLQKLFHCILTENCPQFITPANNLLAGKLSPDVKHKLADVMCNLTGNTHQLLLGIDIDDLSQCLRVKLGGISRVNLQSTSITAFQNLPEVFGFLTILFYRNIKDSKSQLLQFCTCL